MALELQVEAKPYYTQIALRKPNEIASVDRQRQRIPVFEKTTLKSKLDLILLRKSDCSV